MKLRKFVSRCGLGMALILCFCFRTLHWIRMGGLFTREGISDVDSYLLISKNMWIGNWSEIAHYRPTQLLYPLLLSPLHLFEWQEGPYIFWLHQLLALGTVYFAYKTAQKIFGDFSAFCTAILLSLNWRMVGWFNWMYTETIYYFAIALLCYCCLLFWEKQTFRHIFFLVFSCLVSFFVKPESIAAIAAAFILSIFFALRKKNNFRRSLSTCTLVLTITGTTFLGLIALPQIQEKLLTHIHVAHGLFLSTHTAANRNGAEQDRAFIELARLPLGIGAARMRSMSQMGINFIANHPFQYLKKCWIRTVSILFPSLYFDFSPASRILDGLLSFILVFGSFAVVLAYHSDKRFHLGLAIIALSMIILTGIYLADGDTRFRLPIYVVLSILAPAGWMALVPPRPRRI